MPKDHGFSLPISPNQKDFEILEDPLTEHQKFVMEMVLKGHKNKEIAEMMGSSLCNITTHVKNILRKKGLSSRYELMAFELRKRNLEKK